jgi:hypothetical protein
VINIIMGFRDMGCYRCKILYQVFQMFAELRIPYISFQF